MATQTSRTSPVKARGQHHPPAKRRSAARKVSHRKAVSGARTRPPPIESFLERAGHRLQKRLGRAPYLAATATGLGMFALANAIGVGETVIAVAGAYVALRLLRDQASPEKAVSEGLKA